MELWFHRSLCPTVAQPLLRQLRTAVLTMGGSGKTEEPFETREVVRTVESMAHEDVCVYVSSSITASTESPGPDVPASVALQWGCHSFKLCLQIPEETSLPSGGLKHETLPPLWGNWKLTTADPRTQTPVLVGRVKHAPGLASGPIYGPHTLRHRESWPLPFPL